MHIIGKKKIIIIIIIIGSFCSTESLSVMNYQTRTTNYYFLLETETCKSL